MIHTRNLYLKKIEPFLGKNLIKIITGQRRVGKSYFLRQIASKIKRERPETTLLHIEKEKYEFDTIRNYHDLIQYVHDNMATDNKTCIFIDEIQEIEEYEKALRHFQTDENLEIFCSGSNAKMLSGELATHLSGRYIEIQVHSLSYQEFLAFHGLEDSDDALQKFMQFGGMPFLCNLDLDVEIVNNYLKSIYDSVLLKDVVSRYNLRNVYLLEKLATYIADNCGAIVSAKKIADFLKSQRVKITPNVVLNYLSHLKSSFLIDKVSRSDIAGKKIFEVSEKYYWEDIGIRNTIKPYKLGDINKILENIVYHHLRVHDFRVLTGQLPGKKEIDFIAERREKKLYIQVTYLIQNEQTFGREFGNLLQIKDNFPKYVVSMDPVSQSNHQGVIHLHLRDFLLMDFQD